MANTSGQVLESVRSLIHTRRTEKVLASHKSSPALAQPRLKAYESVIQQSLLDSGMAPFHYDRRIDGIAEPWRAHALMQPAARSLASFLTDSMGVTSKEPLLLGACAALALITWLPESDDHTEDHDLSAVKRRRRDEEHLAATGAMVQNFLLLLTAEGLGTYWSSGGVLGESDVFGHLGISPRERLIAAIFIAAPEQADLPATRKPGAHRDKRSDRWIRWCSDPSTLV
ncbi:MAG: nitroreductase family protein [Planctomycetota bacterium]